MAGKMDPITLSVVRGVLEHADTESRAVWLRIVEAVEFLPWWEVEESAITQCRSIDTAFGRASVSIAGKVIDL